MEEIDPQRYVLPGLLALLLLGAFVILVTNGSGDEPVGAVDSSPRSTPAQSSTATTTAPTTTGASSAAPPASSRFTTVQAGDTPASIAARTGISVDRLLELNPSADPDSWRTGQTLKLAP
ncbi:MAG: LysM domain-containing protein [Solirubrobacteraceae bacterium]|nr:LysM domain-containing protein [Solirubrobacteraceae bacterium]